jgi:hypothetical protein
LDGVESFVEFVEDRYTKSLVFFLVSLALEDKSASFKSLNKALHELGDEFSEFAWKVLS